MNIIPYFLLDLSSSDNICILFMITGVSKHTPLYSVSFNRMLLISYVNLLLNRNKFFDAHRYTYIEFFLLKKFCF